MTKMFRSSRITQDDPVVEEITSLINSLSEDEQIDLVALAWLGRDDYSASDWPTVRAEAAGAHNNRTAAYLLGMPLLGDFLEEGFSMLGYSCEEYEIDRLYLSLFPAMAVFCAHDESLPSYRPFMR